MLYNALRDMPVIPAMNGQMFDLHGPILSHSLIQNLYKQQLLVEYKQGFWLR